MVDGERESDGAGSSPDVDDIVVWRIYRGENSWVDDAWTLGRRGVHRLLLGALSGSALAVGRLVRVRARTLDAERGDPLLGHRLMMDQWRLRDHDDGDLTRVLPQLNEVRTVDRPVVVVHGTMSSAVKLALAGSDLAPPGVPIVRFEHDTWRSLESNVEDLIALIGERVTGGVLFIAHSRGGLVAARGAQRLAQSGGVPVTNLITLGTPFDGTPVAVAADVGYMGVRALLGGLRYGGWPVVDVLTRLAGFAIKSTPPRGIQLMDPTNDALPILRDTLTGPVVTVAATADGDQHNRYGLTAFARAVFDGEPATSSSRPPRRQPRERCTSSATTSGTGRTSRPKTSSGGSWQHAR